MGSERAATIGGLVALVAAGACSEQDRVSRPRNAILISIDTLRPDHLGCYGYARATSPHLDEFAAGGVRFEDVTAAAPRTLPSHATMLTGLHPSHHGVTGPETRLSENVVTLAEEFAANGFQTFGVVNVHMLGAPEFQLDQGFADCRFLVETEEEPESLRLRLRESAVRVAAMAQKLVGERDAEKPFFLFVHFYDARAAFQSLERGAAPLSDEKLNLLREDYDAAIRRLDAVLGDFRAWLGAAGLAEETLLVVTSDHGTEFQEHGGLLHGATQYREVLRVPLVLSGPGIPAGVTVVEPVGGVDVAPTILALMGIRSSVERDGLDLSPSWSRGTLPSRSLFSTASGRRESLLRARSGSFELLVDERNGKVELYDVSQDPLQQHDLAPAQPERVEAMREALQRHVEDAVEPEPNVEEYRELERDSIEWLIATPPEDGE